MAVLKYIPVILLLLLPGMICFGNDSDTIKPEQDVTAILNKTNKRFQQQSKEDSIQQGLAAMAKENPELKKALLQYNLFGLEHRRRTLEWNLTSSHIIFWSVILLVFSGIMFAGLQFYAAMYPSKNSVANVNANLATELEANLKGIKVNSPVLGVIILIISFLFFYLYLVYVYPISEIF